MVWLNLWIKIHSSGPWTDQPRKYSAKKTLLTPLSAALSLCGECPENCELTNPNTSSTLQAPEVTG